MTQRGRPRAFDEDEVLDIAMRLFWEHGFDGTSMSDLTEAMGINRRSIYAAFGNKEALFTAALERYLAGPGAFAGKALALPTAREVAESFLRGSVEAFTSSDCPAGCMAVQSVLACSDAGAALRTDLAGRREAGVDAFRERFDRAQLDGDMPADVDTQALAGYIVALSNGIAVQASGGSGRAALFRMVDLALAAWPST
ncbi:TetR/AcrR family transcriptional regulator [Streptomyces hyaluromycini]|uniref:TetR/AcrR family transcriptional regulator n=1 Tax=Streptomyces hyaluromycini TaxID=1377993 RepID=UPI000B5CE834|nr:TetR/AcrR family transcriptional regulator [Streptomyces hyaluromycini]